MKGYFEDKLEKSTRVKSTYAIWATDSRLRLSYLVNGKDTGFNTIIITRDVNKVKFFRGEATGILCR